MRNRWFGALVALLVVVGSFAGPALAQQTGSVEGTISDSNGSPLPGVSIEIKSSALQGTRTTVSDAAGRYKFPVLPPGTYTVTASLSGFTKAEKTNVRVALGGVATVAITLSVSVKEEVVVTGEAPVIDTTKSTLGTSATSETIQKLPLARNFVSIARTVAGTGTDATGGVTVYGATSLENQYIVDGVNTTGIKIGDQGKQLNNEFVQEVEVKTGGYEAEYGRALGGIINVVTKSGGNEFHGDLFGYYDSESLASNDDHTADRQAIGGSLFYQPTRYDYGADLGGFFLKDRIWFFGAYNKVAVDQDYTRVLARTYTGTGGATVGRIDKDGTDETRRDNFSGKLTFRLGESNTIALSAFGDPGDFYGRQLGTAGPDSAVIYGTDQGGTDFTGKWDGIFGTQFLVQAQYGYHTETSKDSSPYANQLAIFQLRRGFTQLTANSGPDLLQDEEYKRHAYKLAGTFFAGTHEIKLGGDYEDIKSSFLERYSGPANASARNYQILANGGAFNYAYQRYFAQLPLNCTKLKNGQTGNFGPVGPGTGPTTCAGYQVANAVQNPPHTKNLAVFLQDTWKVLPNLTVNAGIRYEEQNLLDANGNSAIKIDGEWSPRVGLVWDFLNNGKSKLYASYGRFYTVIPQDIQTRALGNEYTVFSYNYSDATVTGAMDPYTDPAFFAYGYPTLQGGELTQPGLKGMYQDEIIGGFEYEVFKNWSFGVKGIYKALGETIEDRCDTLDPRVGLADYVPSGPVLTTCALVNMGSDNPLGVIKDPTNPECQGPDGDPTTLDGNCKSITPSRIYRGVELTATHRFANNFYVLASYIYSRLQGNYTGNLSQTRENGQRDPNINADFDYIDMTPNNFGILRNDRPHQFKVSGSYTFPFNMTVAANYTFASGRPMSVRGYARPGYSQERFLIARGSFDELPSAYQLDLHLEYGLRLGPVTLSPIVDVFNVTNFQGTTSRDEVFCTSSSTCNARVNEQGVADPTAPMRKDGPYTTARASNPNFNRDIAWQAPRVIRLGARISF